MTCDRNIARLTIRMKKLRIRDRILLGFGLFYDYVGRHMILAARGSYKACLFVPPETKKKSVYNAVYEMLKTGYLEKIIKNGKPYLRITNRGQQAWQRDFSFLAMRDTPWDGKWRLVIFDLPEDKKSIRESLRRKLYKLGFGQLQKSIYINPFDFVQDMAEFLENKHLLGYAFVLTAKHELMGNAQKLANRVWKLEKINREYKKILKELKRLKTINNEQKREVLLRRLFFDLSDLLVRDPILPKELLPDDWLGDKVRKGLFSLI